MRSPYPTTPIYRPVGKSDFSRGGGLPPDYSHNIEMFQALTAAAAVTKRIRLGTGICLIVEGRELRRKEHRKLDTALVSVEVELL